eukprot:3082531-Pyramimonas_sp.AAC.1
MPDLGLLSALRLKHYPYSANFSKRGSSTSLPAVAKVDGSAPAPSFGGSSGSMENLAEQIGKNLNPANNDLFPRMAVRLAHVDSVKGSVAIKR